jgi:wyosine [tRNA(Phe)-imidazoG37] synthetase (radical SAM superfamily)
MSDDKPHDGNETPLKAEPRDGLCADSPRYGFYGRLNRNFPSQVIIDVTDVCNLACVHCPQPLLKKSKFYTGGFLDPVLSAKAVDEVREAGRGFCQYLRYTGEGEPLTHRQLCDILAYAVEKSGTTVALTSNGTLMDEALVERLLDTNVHVVDISIDAHRPETYARIRVKGNLDVTRGNVLRLIARAKERKARTRVVVSYIEQPENKAETHDFQSFWQEAGADYVVVRRLHSAAGAISQTASDMRQTNMSVTRRPCTYPWERIVLNPSGFLCFCPAGWSHSAMVADYRGTTIRETWQGEVYARLRKAHLTGDYSGHQFCGQCPDWSATRWPDEGRSYANMIEDFKACE